MAMSETDRFRAARIFALKAYRDLRETATANLDHIKAAVDAVDDHLDATLNSISGPTNTIEFSFNNALPVPFVNVATVSQKGLLLAVVSVVRYGFV